MTPLTRWQAAALLDVPPGAVRRLVEGGHLASMRRRQAYLLAVEEVERFIEWCAYSHFEEVAELTRAARRSARVA
jgi:excisionase family DNA binding protein